MPKLIIDGKLIIYKIFSNMNLEAGFQFIVLLFLFGSINYLMMLKRYESAIKKKKIDQIRAISKLYPKNTFVKI